MSALFETFDLEKDEFAAMANFFNVWGYVVLVNAVPADKLAELRADLQAANDAHPMPPKKIKQKRHQVHKCFFEQSRATVDLIENSRLTEFAQYVIQDVPGARPNGNSLFAHVIHNNAFSVPPGGRGQAPGWHTDDNLQQVILPPNYVLPPSVRLPILHATYMIWLSDCETEENGPTHVVPGSHRFGRPVNVAEADRMGVPMCGKAGTAVLINPNVWHRGCENRSSIARDTLQITFARRIVGHKFKTIMNYHMPSHVWEGRSETLKQRMGFLEGGAYS